MIKSGVTSLTQSGGITIFSEDNTDGISGNINVLAGQSIVDSASIFIKAGDSHSGKGGNLMLSGGSGDSGGDILLNSGTHLVPAK